MASKAVRGIWPREWAVKRHKIDRLLCGAIATLYENPKAIADLGCGIGLYCAALDYGFNLAPVVGFEGSLGVEDLRVYDNIVEFDLTESYNEEYGTFDLVLCLEVGEHIPEEYEQMFLDNLPRFSNDRLILSWAVPGQYSASGHVNCRPNDYIIEEMVFRSFDLMKRETMFLRKHSSMGWFRKSLMVFKRRQ